MINLEYAKKQFDLYLKNYDAEDEKIHLKKVHTFAVLDAARYICEKEGMSQEDTQLALLIALLHDIGRFEQLKTFQSFDDQKFDHAKFGVKVLFEDGKIRDFVREKTYDDVIEKAIAYHSAYQLPQNLTPRQRLHCQIVRDADKLDNFRVKETEKIETLFDCSEKVFAQEEISDCILEDIREEQIILSSTRKTNMDRWVSYLAFIFDLNFPASFQFLEEHRYIDKNIGRIAYTNPQTKKRMEEIRAVCNAYVRRNLPPAMRKTCRAVVFDMDGVMFDSERVIQRAWEKVGDEMGYQHFGEHSYHTLGMNTARTRQYFAETIGPEFPYDLFKEKYKKLVEEEFAEKGIPVKPGLEELLGFLREKKIPIAVATSSSERDARYKLSQGGALPYLDALVCGNMVEHSKPDPEIYEKVCEALHVAPQEAIALEDSENGLKAAMAAGMRTIMVPDMIRDLPEIEGDLEAKLDSLSEVKIYIEHLGAGEGQS
ncbi:MAG: HAD-IA family hydrolase [Lachnospiraceae bacterium]|nr:HAD-IA family hydrolase [Lachnospiraceae bacterium]